MGASFSMKLTLLTTSYPLTPDSNSGIFVARLVENLPKHIAVSVILPAASRLDILTAEQENPAILPFRYAPRQFQILAHAPGGIPVALKNHKWTYLLVPQFLVAMFIRCLRSARKSKIIHANWAICGLIGGIAGYLCNIPTVTTVRGEDITRARKSVFDRIILSCSMKLSTRIVTVSNSIAKWLLEQYPQSLNKIRLIANGVSDKFLLINPPSGTQAKNYKIRLITIGSLIQRKGVDQIIHALKRLNNCVPLHLTIVGDGPEKQTLMQLVVQNGLSESITFVGSIDPDQIPQLLAAADVSLLASHSEGRPNVVLESMAAGRPVIATDIEGVNELITHGRNGLLFQDGAIEELAAHIMKLAEDQEARLAMGLAAREFIIEHGLLWSNTANKYTQLYYEAIEEYTSCAG
ncbi:MAG: hypothetical protein A2511_12230 [Deltaproteobacteria bacterium RIFOXYD12_FULL_50_9]|nr:MAG: hypothetical protein A2511_12230 [Deltaproteobacteria bacterium RIFOXYD12_FULL_50_9]